MQTIEGYVCSVFWPADERRYPVLFGSPKDSELEVENITSSRLSLFPTEKEALKAFDVIQRIHAPSEIRVFWLHLEVAEGEEMRRAFPAEDGEFIVIAVGEKDDILLGPFVEGCSCLGYIGADFTTNGFKPFLGLQRAIDCAEQVIRQGGMPVKAARFRMEEVCKGAGE